MQVLARDSSHVIFERVFESTLSNVSMVTRQLADFCREEICKSESDEIVIEQIELCVAEALTNVVRHAYAQHEDSSIWIACALVGNDFIIRIEDKGCELPRHVLATIKTQEISTTSDLPESGFGWFLIMSQMDKVTYRREGQTNHLKMTKRFP